MESDARLNETRVKPQEREVHVPHLEKLSKCWDRAPGSMEPVFNKQRQTQAHEVKMRRSSNPHLAYQCKGRIWKSNAGV